MTATLTLFALLITLVTGPRAEAQPTPAPPPVPRVIAVIEPIPNGGAGLNNTGPFYQWRTLTADHREQVNRSLLWRPVRKEQFRPGEMLGVYRIDCFLNKTTGPVRAMLLGTGTADGRAHFWPPANPPKRTEAVPSANVTRPDGPAGPFGACDAFNFLRQLPGPDAQDAYNPGKPLWTREPAWWIYRAWVDQFWTVEQPYVPTHFRDVWIQVGA